MGVLLLRGGGSSGSSFRLLIKELLLFPDHFLRPGQFYQDSCWECSFPSPHLSVQRGTVCEAEHPPWTPCLDSTG